MLERAIHSAVLDLVIEQGAAGVTMEAVAVRAATNKPVLYRRWPDRAALLRETLVPLAMEAIPHTDTGGYRGNMLAILRGWAEFFASPRGPSRWRSSAPCLTIPSLPRPFGAGSSPGARRPWPTRWSRAIARGELRPDVPVEIARGLGQAFLWHRFLVSGDDITDELIVHIVDEILIPYGRP